MSCIRSALMLIASCAFHPVCVNAALASDLTLANLDAPAHKRPAKAHKPHAAAIARQRMEKPRHQKISAYSLREIAQQRDALEAIGLASTAGNADPGSLQRVPHQRLPQVAANTPIAGPGTEAAGAGSFDCREKPAPQTPSRRDMTACYVHKLDKSWSTQTYVSRRSADGNSAWGGGLAVGYDY